MKIVFGVGALAVALACARPAEAQLATGDPQAKFDLTLFAASTRPPTWPSPRRSRRGDAEDRAHLGARAERHAGRAGSARHGGLGRREGRPRRGRRSAQPNSFFFYMSIGNDNLNKHKVQRATLGADNRLTFDAAT
jgi:hypothetical protein